VDLEYQRYGRNKETAINHSYINSGEYRSKFDRITDNISVNRAVYDKAREMLNHRSGTTIEDMYWIDKDTGDVIASVTNQTDDIVEQVQYPKSVKNAIKGKNNLIAMHTHPESMPPSAADFNSAYYNNYSIALVICHDGKILQYTSNQPINERMYIAYVQNYIKDGYSEYDAQLKAIEELKKSYDIDFWEVKS